MIGRCAAPYNILLSSNERRGDPCSCCSNATVEKCMKCSGTRVALQNILPCMHFVCYANVRFTSLSAHVHSFVPRASHSQFAYERVDRSAILNYARKSWRKVNETKLNLN